MADVVQGEAAGARPKVVVIVQPRAQSAGASRDGAATATATLPPPSTAIAAMAATTVAPPGARQGDIPTAVGSLPARPPAEADRPTERIRKTAKLARTELDEKLVAAVIPLDLSSTPSPLADFLGRSLLFRAARAALSAGAPRLIIVGNIPADRQRQVYDEAYAGFGGRPVEVRAGDPVIKDFSRGRALILDASALHDPDAVRRLAQARGEEAALLVTRQGDGLRVRVEDGKVRELGVDASVATGAMAGACSIPVERFERMTQVGERAALEELTQSDQLRAILVRRSYAQQLHSPQAYEGALVSAWEPIASGGGANGLFEDVIGRPIARVLTRFMLHRPAFTPSGVSAAAGVLALVGAFFILFASALPGGGRVPLSSLALVLAGLFLVSSAVLDRSDGELARLRLEEDDDQRYLDFGLDHVAHMIVFAALAWAVDPPEATGPTAWGRLLASAPAWLLEPLRRHELDDPMRIGVIAIAGVVVLMGVLLWRGAPRGDSTGLRRLADGLASAFNSRDYFYLFTVAALFNLVPMLAAKGLTAYFLLATAALVHVTWLVILLLSLVSPAPPEE